MQDGHHNGDDKAGEVMANLICDDLHSRTRRCQQDRRRGGHSQDMAARLCASAELVRSGQYRLLVLRSSFLSAEDKAIDGQNEWYLGRARR